MKLSEQLTELVKQIKLDYLTLTNRVVDLENNSGTSIDPEDSTTTINYEAIDEYLASLVEYDEDTVTGFANIQTASQAYSIIYYLYWLPLVEGLETEEDKYNAYTNGIVLLEDLTLNLGKANIQLDPSFLDLYVYSESTNSHLIRSDAYVGNIFTEGTAIIAVPQSGYTLDDVNNAGIYFPETTEWEIRRSAGYESGTVVASSEGTSNYATFPYEPEYGYYVKLTIEDVTYGQIEVTKKGMNTVKLSVAGSLNILS